MNGAIVSKRARSFLLTLSFSLQPKRPRHTAVPCSGRCHADRDRPIQPAGLAVLPSAGEARGGGVSSLFLFASAREVCSSWR
jgi:hypothetical protein